MARKLKHREPTDVVSVRLPVSLIEKLDGICDREGIGRADVIAGILRGYRGRRPRGKATRLVSNSLLIAVGMGVGVFAAVHSGSGTRRWAEPAWREMGAATHEDTGPGALRLPVPVPIVPPRNLAELPAYRWGNIQFVIPRLPAWHRLPYEETPP